MLKMKFGSLFTIILLTVMVFSLASFVIAKAEQNQGGQNQFTTQNQNQEQEQNGTNTDNDDATNTKGQLNAQEHRSVVANFVQSLLEAASSTEGGIGQQVRVIAQQQNDSDSTVTEAITAVNNRNKIKTFLFGSDYKNLGALRSEVVHTRNRLEQLNRLMENATGTDATSTAEIQSQIQTMEQEQLRIENFIKEQEGKFSLFGWLIKLFNR